MSKTHHSKLINEVEINKRNIMLGQAFFKNIEPSSFLIKNDGRQITNTEISNSKTKAILISIPDIINERLVIKMVNNKINNVDLR